MNIKTPLTSKNRRLRLPHNDPKLYKFMSERITSYFPKYPRNYIAICIGTDRSTGDSLGPLTGSFFSEYNPKHINVYGTLHEPVHAQNLDKYVNLIKQKYRNPFIIAIDACLGRSKSVGHIITGIGPIKPGAALQKDLPSIGNIHITGIVNISGFMEYAILQNTRLSVVIDMAKKIANILNLIDQQLMHYQSLPAVLNAHSTEQQIQRDS